jgi:hypothetical protein
MESIEDYGYNWKVKLEARREIIDKIISDGYGDPLYRVLCYNALRLCCISRDKKYWITSVLPGRMPEASRYVKDAMYVEQQANEGKFKFAF